MAGVQRTQSPSDRKRMIATRLFCARSSIINDGFIDQHHRNIVANRVKAMAGDAAQAAAIGLEFNFGPARGTNQDFEQISTEGHV